MDGGAIGTFRGRGRIAAAALVGLFSALGVWLIVTSSPAAAGGGAGDALLPDLIVEPPEDIVLQRGATKKQIFLRFEHVTSNVGAGPVEIAPELESDDCQDRGDRAHPAYQTVYHDGDGDGVFDPSIDTEKNEQSVGCMIFHDIHNHYHFEDFAEYALYRAESGVLKATSEKVSFCVFDFTRLHPDLDGSPDSMQYHPSNCAVDSGIHGISVGWADVYGSSTPGQEFDLTGLKRPGRFCLVAKTDPADRLEEVATGGEDNNVQTAQIRVNKKNASEFGAQVPVLDKPCAPPATP
jgi:hypothetical protein